MHTQKLWSREEMRRRLDNLYDLMDEAGLDAVFLTSVHNVVYYTGFYCPPYGRLHSAVIPRHGEPALIASLIEDERPALCCYYDDIRLFHDWEMNPTDNNIRLLKEVLADNGIACGRLGYEEDVCPVALKRLLDERVPGFEWADVGTSTMRRRLIKSDEEISVIRHGVQLCEVGGYAAIDARLSPASPRSRSRAPRTAPSRTSCASASPTSRSTT